MNSVHVVECDSIDAEACSNGPSLHKLSALRQPHEKPESESLDTNNIIQISISAEQTPDPNHRTGHRKNSTFTDSMSPNIRDNKEALAAIERLDGQEQLKKASTDNPNTENEERDAGRLDEPGDAGANDGPQREAVDEPRSPACSLSNQGKSRNSLSLLECSEVLSSGKMPETFDFLMRPSE